MSSVALPSTLLGRIISVLMISAGRSDIVFAEKHSVEQNFSVVCVKGTTEHSLAALGV